MEITFLQATVPLTKTFEKRPDGTISKSSYPNVYEVTTHREAPRDMRDLEQLIKAYAAKAYCLVKGNPTKDLHKQSRAGTTDSSATTDWVCFDIDGLPSTVPETFLAALSLSDVSYVIQYSASYGIENKDLRCHIFMQLDKPMAAPLLKQWLIELNLTTPLLNSSIRLSKTGNALSWPLDISACQNDKLLYISAPTLKGLRDPLPKNGRIQFVRKDKDTLTINHAISTTAKNRERAHKRLDELRDAEGLPKRKTSYRMHGGLEVMVKPDVCTVTEVRQERGFVYFNLNGGDSWAYYHPEDRPDYIYNFKGEPVYVTKELLPDYWRELTSSASRVSSAGIAYLAFCDRTTSTYWRGTYDQPNDNLHLTQAKNETQIRHFAAQVGLPLGDFIPEWDLVFNPKSPTRVDFAGKQANLFKPTEYMKQGKKRNVACPPVTQKIVMHAVGGQQEVYDHFMNWAAYILQNLEPTGTAWVLSGTEGTGKGLMMNRILRPVFGAYQTTVRRMEELAEKYNDWMRNVLFVFVDEVQTSALQNEGQVMAKVRNFVTEPMITVRAMHAIGTEVSNYSNWMFFSNAADPVKIPKNDRRYNVGRFQPDKLKISDQELDRIEYELQDFHDFLLTYKVDKDKARTPLDSDERNQLISIGEASVDTVAAALLAGNFEFFVDSLPSSDTYKLNALTMAKVSSYEMVLKDIFQRTDRNTGACNVSRDELQTIFDFTVGGTPNTPHKFTSYLKHHRIHITKVWVGTGSANGLALIWKDKKLWPQIEQRLFPQQGQKAKPKLTAVPSPSPVQKLKRK